MKFESFPKELKTRAFYVNWKFEANPKNPDKPKKPPIDPNTGRKASVTDSDTWATFDTVVKQLKKGGVDGIGIVLTEEMGLTVIDIDKCRNKKTGKINSYARK